MSFMRQDALTGRWVAVAAGRKARPNDFRQGVESHAKRKSVEENCPFCPGHEAQTPTEVFVCGREETASANSQGWKIRAFPNKYPAMLPTAESPIHAAPSLLTPSGAAQGGHEVLVCSPYHDQGLADLSAEHLNELLRAINIRNQAMQDSFPDSRYVLTFGNQGPMAGATLAHSHMQMISTPVVPALVVDKQENFIRHRENTGHCLLCDLIQNEERDNSRVIASNSSWLVVAPWASRFAFEMRFIPRRCQTGMPLCNAQELKDLADILSFSLNRLESVNSGANFNLVIHNAPVASRNGCGYGNERLDAMLKDRADDFHWHLEILPRLSRMAGFETGTGFAINSVPAEEAAAALRKQ